MTPSDVRVQLVRPRFLKWSIVVFLLLTPFVVHSVWDYVETRRLRTRIDTIAARGEPTTARVQGMLTGRAAESARYYAAAAALVAGYAADIPGPLAHELMVAERGRNWPEELAEQARSLVQRHAEALMFADRAAGLPFEGLQVNSTFPYLIGNLFGVFRLCVLRAQILALDGKADAAIESIYSAVRVARVTNHQMPSLSALAFVLQRAQPSDKVLAKLDGALRELDRDDRLRWQLLRARASTLDQGSMISWFDTGFKTWDVHRLNERLDLFARLIAAAERPPAERHAAVMTIGQWPQPGVPSGRARDVLESVVSGSERQTDAIRCARRLVAGEVVDCRF